MYHQSLNVPRSSRDGGNGSGGSSGQKSLSFLEQPGRAYSTQSILTAMNRFVRSVDNMHATILVPSKLRDMQLDGRVPPPHPIKASDPHSFYGVLNDVKDELLWGPGSVLLSSEHPSQNLQLSRPHSSSQQQQHHHHHHHSVPTPMPTNSGLGGSGSLSSSYSAGPASNGRNHVLRAPSVLGTRETDSLGSAGSDQDTDSDSLSESMLTDPEVQGVLKQSSGSKTDSESLSDTTGSEEGRDSLEHGRHLASAFRHHLQGLHVILHQLADSADYLTTRYQQEIESSDH
ncbi:mid1-interacting protein 1-like [Tropilaelaps mercedesae]|uniref:Mid1-interacting protein 1-like n=1 Tax=Tropilaelaps mercedesae TaxID=418985 RepID=A0A1V9XHP0_9ACAR|nr:mid1-interacting protein 1-like [Tropilaelaps mercedesae]